MDALYVIEPGSYLRREGNCLKIVREQKVVDTIPAEGLKQLTLAGRVALTAPVLDFLLQNNIDTVFLTLTGRFRARLLMDRSGHVLLRQAQYRYLDNEDNRVQLAKDIVAGKLNNQIRILLKHRDKGDIIQDVRDIAIQIKALKLRLLSVETLEEIRGIEGYASRLFFSVFGFLIKGGFTFVSRNRRPPRDPVNALLSFVYTLFTNTVLSAIQRTGLDPYLGALHEPAHGRPSLACDLVEEWRGFGERLVLRLINKRMVRQDDFVYKNITGDDTTKQVLMKPQALKALITTYHRLLERPVTYPHNGERTKIRWIIHQQATRICELVKEERDRYTPFLISR